MAINFNTGPYYDDFDPANNFYKILFKPGYAVQTRELNQLQSILQHQVSSAANHLFKKNTVVIPGGISLNSTADILSIAGIEDPSILVGRTITNALSFDYNDDTTLDGYITAVVLGYKTATSTQPAALYIKYIKSSTENDETTTKFVLNEPLVTVDVSQTEFRVDGTYGSAVGKVATLSKGTFYTKELFVEAPNQSLIIETSADTQTNCVVGLNILESIVTSDDDSSLLDNSNGTPNQYAPGADRYKVDLILTRIDLSEPYDDEKFIKLMVVEDNVITYLNNNTQYAELMKTMARRTYDANGNFIVNGLDSSVLESSDDDKLWMNVGAGKCYLGGYEYNQLSLQSMVVDKPRSAEYQIDIEPVSTYSSGMTYFYVAGNTFKQSQPQSLPESDTLVQLLNAEPGTVDSVVIGYAVFKYVQYVGGSIASKTDYYKAFCEHITLEKGFTLSDVGGINVVASDTGMPVLHELTLSGAVGNFVPSQFIEAGVTGTVAQTAQIYTTVSNKLYVIKHSLQTVPNSGTIKAVVPTPRTVTKTGVSSSGTTAYVTSTADLYVGMSLSITTGVGNLVGGTIIQSIDGFTQITLSSEPIDPLAGATIEFSDVVILDTGTTASRASTFVSNYSTDFIPMISVDTDVIKTLYHNGTPSPTFSSVRVDEYEIDEVISGTKTYEPQTLLGTNEYYESVSTNDFYAYNITDGEFVADFVDLVEVSSANKYQITVPENSPLCGKNIRVFSTYVRENVSEAQKTLTTKTLGFTIPTPSGSWMALGDQEVVQVIKIVDGQTIVTDTVSYTGTWSSTSTNVSIKLLANHGLQSGDTVVLKGIKSSNNTTGAFNVGYNGMYSVVSVTSADTFVITITDRTNPGSFVAAGSAALPPDISTDVDITSRFILDRNNSMYGHSTSLIKLKKKAIAPEGQIAVVYSYYQITTPGGYVSVDSYDDPTQPTDLSYIGTIPDVILEDGTRVPTRNKIDFRSSTSNFFFKNFGSIASGSSKLILKDLNLSGLADSLTSAPGTVRTVVGPSHNNDAIAIERVEFNPETGDTELTLATEADANYLGTYYVGLSGLELSLADPSAGAVSFTFPKDNTRIAYRYTKFTPRRVIAYVNRKGDELKVDVMDVSSVSEVLSLRRNEFKLPLAYLYMKPYCIGLDDVSITKFENPVYQMLDIHNLKERIDRNEYYTSLALENDVHKNIIDAMTENLNQTSRGFWNEDFQNVNGQDTTSDDFSCTIYDKSYVSPGTITTTVNLELDQSSNTTTWQRTGSNVTLPYTEISLFSNSMASKFNNLNPFNVISWPGKLTLNPSIDNWIDTATAAIPVIKSTVQTPAAITSQIPAPAPATPPAVLPAPPVVEVITEISNLRTAWGRDSLGGNHGITFNWKTNLGKTGRVNTDTHLAPVLLKYSGGINGTYARSLINKPYNDVGVKDYLNAGTHFDQRPPSQW